MNRSPNLVAIEDTITNSTPLSKNDSERALSIIRDHFHKLEEPAPITDRLNYGLVFLSATRQPIELPPKKHWIRQTMMQQQQDDKFINDLLVDGSFELAIEKLVNASKAER